jgi:GNAT superfamily N-acetyltransferase
MAARAATAADVERMVELADKKRRDYEPHAPVFHRPAIDASEAHRPWLSALVKDPDVGTFVHEDSEREVDGFVVITTVPAPPVYDPGGLSSLIDDFAVSSPDRWATAGTALLAVATDWARERGAVQVVVVSGPHDEEKRATLRNAGLYVVSEWFTKAIPPEA